MTLIDLVVGGAGASFTEAGFFSHAVIEDCIGHDPRIHEHATTIDKVKQTALTSPSRDSKSGVSAQSEVGAGRRAESRHRHEGAGVNVKTLEAERKCDRDSQLIRLYHSIRRHNGCRKLQANLS